MQQRLVEPKPTFWCATPCARHMPSRSTFCGVAHRLVNTSSGMDSAMGRKLKMPPPLLLTSTTVSGGRISPVRNRLRPLTSCRKERSPSSRVAGRHVPSANPVQGNREQRLGLGLGTNSAVRKACAR